MERMWRGEPLQKWLVMAFLFVFLPVFVGVSFVPDMLLSQEPSRDNCIELTSVYGSLTSGDCIRYMMDNPGSTGHDVLDYYNINEKYDMLLTEPLD